MKFIRKIKNFFEIWYERNFGEYVTVRQFDLKRAQEFYNEHKSELQDMAFCMGFDDSIWHPIVEDGQTIVTPVCLNRVDGVERTFYDVPCFYYRFKSGVEGKMYCFKACWYNKKSDTYKYLNPLYGSLMQRGFGVFEEHLFEDKFGKTYHFDL